MPYFLIIATPNCFDFYTPVYGQRSRSYCHIVGKIGRIYCRLDTEWTISSRILQLAKIDQHDEKKMPIVFKSGQRSRSYCHIEGKGCRQNTEWTISSRIIQLCTIDHHAERKMLKFFKVGGPNSRSYCNIIGKRDRIHCRQDTDWIESSRSLQLGTIDNHDKRKMRIVIQSQRWISSLRKVL